VSETPVSLSVKNFFLEMAESIKYVQPTIPKFDGHYD